jgi:hypothetical protein
MQTFKIVLKKNELIKEEVESELNFSNGYLFYNVSEIQPGIIVNSNNIINFLENPRNKNISERFFDYLKKNTTKIQYLFLKNNPKKLFIIFNNFYLSVIINNSLPNFNLIKESLFDTKEEYYKNNFFDFETQLRKNNKSKQLIELKFKPEEGDEIKGKQEPQFISDYYVHVFIDTNQREVLSTDYSKYLKNSFENGQEFVNSFVNLNKKNNPFDIWNDSSELNIINIDSLNVNISTGLKNRLKNLE